MNFACLLQMKAFTVLAILACVVACITAQGKVGFVIRFHVKITSLLSLDYYRELHLPL